jgi:CheY-like chemotaxis protein
MNELNGSDASEPGMSRSFRLVVADDMTLNADSLSDVLRMMGHEVVTVYNGLDAVEAHSTFAPDAFLLDLGMPGTDGYETCRMIRGLPGGENVAIVALSGWGRQEDLAHALESGFSGFLLKPAHPRDIMRSLSGIWSKKTPPSNHQID